MPSELDISTIEVGSRVKVFDGDGTTYLGEGVYEGDFEAWAIVVFDQAGNPRLLSTPMAEKPTAEVMLDNGLQDGVNCRVQRLPQNPRILLDDGTVKWGCQVWWEPAKES